MKSFELLIKHLLLFDIPAIAVVVVMLKYHAFFVADTLAAEIAIFILAISIIGVLTSICRYFDGTIQDKLI